MPSELVRKQWIEVSMWPRNRMPAPNSASAPQPSREGRSEESGLTLLGFLLLQKFL